MMNFANSVNDGVARSREFRQRRMPSRIQDGVREFANSAKGKSGVMT